MIKFQDFKNAANLLLSNSSPSHTDKELTWFSPRHKNKNKDKKKKQKKKKRRTRRTRRTRERKKLRRRSRRRRRRTPQNVPEERERVEDINSQNQEQAGTELGQTQAKLEVIIYVGVKDEVNIVVEVGVSLIARVVGGLWLD